MAPPAAELLTRRDETIVPAECYTTCNDVYLKVQQAGKTEALCLPGSDFLNALATCNQCVGTKASDKSTQAVYAEPKFQQFLTFCEGVDRPEYEWITMTRTQLIDVTSSNGWVQIGVLTTVIVTEVMPSGAASSSTDPFPTTLSSTDTTTTPSSASSSSPTAAAAATETGQIDPHPKTSNAWIAGPVIGAICVILLLLGGYRCLKRRRKQEIIYPPAILDLKDDKGQYERAQLHGDHVPRAPPMELEGSYPKPATEMSANEVAAQEMLASGVNHVAEMPEKHV